MYYEFEVFSMSESPVNNEGSPSQKDEEWRKVLTPEQYRVTRRKGTERAFTGEFHDCKTARIAVSVVVPLCFPQMPNSTQGPVGLVFGNQQFRKTSTRKPTEAYSCAAPKCCAVGAMLI